MSTIATENTSPVSTPTSRGESSPTDTGPQHSSGAWGRAALGLKLYLFGPFIAVILLILMNIAGTVETASHADSIVFLLVLSGLPAIGALLFSMTPLPAGQRTLLKVTAGAFTAATVFVVLGFALPGLFGMMAEGLAAIGLGLWVLPMLGWILMSFALRSTAETLEVFGVEKNIKHSWIAVATAIVAMIAAPIILFTGAVATAVMLGWVSSVSFLVAGALHLAAASKVQSALAMRHMDEELGLLGSDDMELA